MDERGGIHVWLCKFELSAFVPSPCSTFPNAHFHRKTAEMTNEREFYGVSAQTNSMLSPA